MRLFVFLLVFLQILVVTGAEQSQWRQLPLTTNGKVNTNWVHIGYGDWEVDGSGLKTKPDSKGIGLLVYTKERLGNCQLKVVFRAQDTNCNSGIYVRIGDGILDQINNPGAANELNANGEPSEGSIEKMKLSSEKLEGPWYAVHQGYEVQIDSSLVPESTPYNGTGAIYSLAKTKSEFADTTKWSTYIITLAGEQIRVELNGDLVSSFNPVTDKAPPRGAWYEPMREFKRPQAGYIGLQTHDPKDIVFYKEISVRPLSQEEIQSYTSDQ